MISPILNNGIITQTQNVNYINNNAEHRTEINYQHIQTNVQNSSEVAHRTVVASNESAESNTQHDARDEGRNKYFDNRNKDKKKESKPDGIVKKKDSGGFDFRV